MNVIEALVVTLGLDNTEFKTKEREVTGTIDKFVEKATKQTKTFASTGKQMTDTFRSLKTEIIGVAAAFLGFEGLKSFVSGTVNSQAALGRLAANTNTSAATLKAWGTVAEEVGAKASDAYQVFDRINQQMAQASVTGTSPLLVMMRRLGVEGLTNQSSMEDVLLRFSARLRQLPRNQAQYAANEAGMGGIFNELMLGPDQLRQRLAEAYRLMPATFDQSTQRAQQLQKQMALLKLQFEGVKLQIWNELEPALMALFKLLMKGLNEVDWNAVAQWISNLVPNVQHLFHEVENLDTASGSWLKTLGLLAAAWLALSAVLAASPVGLVLLLAGSLLALYNDYETWKKGGKSLINWAQWKNEIDLAKAGIQGLITVLDALGNAVKRSTSWVMDKAGGFAARKAAEIASQKTAEDRRELGSPIYHAYVEMAQLAGYDPLTGKKIAIDYENPDGSSGAPSRADQSAWDDAIDAARGTSGGSAPNASGGVSDAFLDRVARVESGNNPLAVSKKGAVGAYQLLPATGAAYGLTTADLQDPAKERVAARVEIQRLLGVYHGNLSMAMAAYNWGQGNVSKYGMGALPAETRAYLGKLGLSPSGGATSYDHSSQQIGPIIVQVQPGADAGEIARNIQAELRKVNLPAAVNTGGE